MSYLIPTEELSLASQAHLREVAEVRGVEMLIGRKLLPNEKAAVARDPDYVLDFIPVAVSAGLSGWLSMPLAVVGTAYSVFASNVPAAITPTVLNNTVVVFYGCHIIDANNPQAADELYFGIGQPNNRKSTFNLQKLFSKMSSDGYFSEPVVYKPQDIINAQVKANIATGVGYQIVLDTMVIEPIQQTDT